MGSCLSPTWNTVHQSTVFSWVTCFLTSGAIADSKDSFHRKLNTQAISLSIFAAYLEHVMTGREGQRKLGFA